MSGNTKDHVQPSTPDTKETTKNQANNNQQGTCGKDCYVISFKITHTESGMIENRIPPGSNNATLTLHMTQDLLNKPITLENGATIQLNEDGTVLFDDHNAYKDLKVGESFVQNIEITLDPTLNTNLALLTTLSPTAAGEEKSEGSSEVITIAPPNQSGEVDSVGRDLSINNESFLQEKVLDTVVSNKINGLPVAPEIILDPTFEIGLRENNDNQDSGSFNFLSQSSYGCDPCYSYPTIVMTNIFAEGASFGLDGPGSYSLVPIIRQGITISDILDHADAIGFTDPGGISHFFPAPYQSQTTFYIDPAGFQVITTPEGNTLTLYTADVNSYKAGDLVFELHNPVLHIPGLSDYQVVDTIICGVESQVMLDPFSYTIVDSSGDVATNFIFAQIVDDQPYAQKQYACIDEADIMTVGSNQLSYQAQISGSLIDNIGTGFGADGGIISNVTIENGVTTIDPMNNLIRVVTAEGNVLEVQQTTGLYTYYLINPIDNDSSVNATDLQALDIFTVELTDFDLDQINTTLTVTIKDDVPYIINNYSEYSSGVSIVVDETDLNTPSTGDFSSAFTIIPGADLAQSIVYKLGISAPDADTGLVDTITNEAVTLSISGNDVIGSSATGGQVFKIEVNASSGVVTVTQQRAVVHPDSDNPNDVVSLASNLISLSVTVTDNDQDTKSDSINIGNTIQLYDDAPSFDENNTPVHKLTVDESNFNTNASSSFSALFSGSFGNDGPKDTDDHNGEADSDAVAYSLEVNGISPLSGLVHTLSNENVVLSLESGAVVGRTEWGGVEVFRVTVSASGVVTLDQKEAVVHPTADPDESKGLASADLIKLTQTLIDGDEDQASKTIDIGDAFVFKDDGPAVSVVAVQLPTLTVDESNFGADSSSSFSGLFSVLFGADGFKDSDNNDSQDSDAITYQLGINAGSTGLVDTLSNQSVVLSVSGGIVYGKTSGSGLEVFKVLVNANTGVVTLDQSRAIVHPTTNPDETKGLAAANLITLQATATDGDGDTDSKTVNIGSNLIFKDDGPNVSQSSSESAILTVDESNFGTDASGSFSGLFSVQFGADGFKDSDNNNVQDSDAITYQLGINGSGTGLVDTLTNQSIVLSVSGAGDIILGKTSGSGDEVFRVTVDSSGVVTLNQSRAIVHPTSAPDESITLTDNLIFIKATAVDGDGDSDFESINIGSSFEFKDDAPVVSLTVSATPTLTVDESNFASDASGSFSSLFSVNFGADGFKDTDNNNLQDSDAVTYQLGINAGSTGLVDTLTNEAVNLSLLGGIVYGKSATGGEVFRVTVDSSGVVTLNQSRAIVHPTTAPDESKGLAAANLITLTLTAVDGDGDSGNQIKNIGDAFLFKDDAPVVSLTGAVTPTLTVDESNFAADSSSSFSGLFSVQFGADGFKDTDNNNAQDSDAITYQLGINAGSTGLVDTLTNEAVTLSLLSGIVYGKSATGGEVFRVTVDSSGVVTLDQSRAIVHPTTNPDETKGLAAASLITLSAIAVDGDGDSGSQTKNIGDAFFFKDDGPNVDVIVENVAPLVLQVDNTNLAANATGDFSSYFSISSIPGADGTGSLTSNYSLSITGGDGTYSGLDDLDSGDNINLFLTGAGTVIQGKTTGGQIDFTITLNSSTGFITFDQIHEVAFEGDEAHSLANLITLTNTTTLVDKDTDFDTDSETVNIGQSFIIDAGVIPPQANPNSYNFASSYGPINLLLILDYSGSMFSAPDDGGDLSKLQILHNVVMGPDGIIESFNSISTELNIIPVIFGSAAVTETFLWGGNGASLNDAVYYLATTQDGGGTSYTLALATATLAIPDFPSGIPTVSIFISDGAPDTSIVGTPDETNWQDTLADYGIDAYAVNISGSPALNAELVPTQNHLPILSANSSLSNLADIILAQTQQITGNILNDDFLGSAASYTIQSFSQIGAPIVNGTVGVAFTTASGATLTVQANGDFVYEASLSVLQQGLSEVFDYTLVTNLSDTSSSTFTINTSSTTEPGDIAPVANSDLYVLPGAGIVGNELPPGQPYLDANAHGLLFNDTDADGGAKYITSFTYTDFTTMTERTITPAAVQNPLGNFTYGTVTLASGAIFQLSTDGTFFYQYGSSDAPIDTITYTLNGGSSATASFQVTGANPVIIDLDNNGNLELTNTHNGIEYDLLHNGVNYQVGWLGENDGLLIYDMQGDGQVTEAKEFIFTQWDHTAKTDMEALRNVFDTNHDGLLTLDDEGWQHFGIWQDINHDGISQAGEYKTLMDMGVNQLDLHTDGVVEYMNGNTIHGSSLLHFEDGSTLSAYDVTLAIGDVVEQPSSLNQSLDGLASNDASSPQSSSPTAEPPATTQQSEPAATAAPSSDSGDHTIAPPPLANDVMQQELQQQQHQEM